MDNRWKSCSVSRRFADVPYDLITSVALGYTAGQCRHGGDVSAVCFLLKDDRIAHRVWPLILIIPANTPRTAAVRQFLTGIVWLRGRRLQLPGDASRVRLWVGDCWLGLLWEAFSYFRLSTKYNSVSTFQYVYA